MADKNPVVAILYDFDKTLCTKDMQEYAFIPSLGLSAEEFWSETGKLAKAEKTMYYTYRGNVKNGYMWYY